MLNARIMEILSSKRDETAQSVSDHNDRLLALKEENAGLRRELSKLVSQQVVSKLKEKAAAKEAKASSASVNFPLSSEATVEATPSPDTSL